jgi:hypothetical protein
MAGLIARTAQRLPAMGTVVWHNWRLWEAGQLDTPLRSLIPYDD